jgi:anti-anti-sigma factor
MHMRSEKKGARLVVSVSGRLDAVTASDFETGAQGWIAAGEKNVLVDLEELEYISSAGLRAILASAKKLKAGQGQMEFCGLTGMVQEVFSISGFNSIFNIHASQDEALAAG